MILLSSFCFSIRTKINKERKKEKKRKEEKNKEKIKIKILITNDKAPLKLWNNFQYYYNSVMFQRFRFHVYRKIYIYFLIVANYEHNILKDSLRRQSSLNKYIIIGFLKIQSLKLLPYMNFLIIIMKKILCYVQKYFYS